MYNGYWTLNKYYYYIIIIIIIHQELHNGTSTSHRWGECIGKKILSKHSRKERILYQNTPGRSVYFIRTLREGAYILSEHSGKERLLYQNTQGRSVYFIRTLREGAYTLSSQEGRIICFMWISVSISMMCFLDEILPRRLRWIFPG